MNLREDVYVVRGTTFEEGEPLHTLAYPGELDVVAIDGAPAFGQYGLVSRPSAANDNGQCEAIVADVGGTNVVVATRDLRAEKVVGKLEEGDVALWSVGQVCALLKAAGVLSLRKNGTDGSTDAFIQIEADGAILLRNQWGGIEIGPNGVLIHAGDQAFKLGGGSAQITANSIGLAGGSIGFGPAPTIPMSFVPLSGVPVPAKSLFFTP